jgi:DNA gyrase subunit A
MRRAWYKEQRRGGREQLVVTEIPYATNKTRIIEQIAELVKRGKLTDVSDLRDESDRDGIRLVIELKRGATPSGAAAALQVDGAAEHLRRDQPGAGRRGAARVLAEGDPGALPRPPHRGGGAPLALGAGRARDEAHVLEGLLVALKNIDRGGRHHPLLADRETAGAKLQKELKLTERQAEAILNMRLYAAHAAGARELQDRLASWRSASRSWRRSWQPGAAARGDPRRRAGGARARTRTLGDARSRSTRHRGP